MRLRPFSLRVTTFLLCGSAPSPFVSQLFIVRFCPFPCHNFFIVRLRPFSLRVTTFYCEVLPLPVSQLFYCAAPPLLPSCHNFFIVRLCPFSLRVTTFLYNMFWCRFFTYMDMFLFLKLIKHQTIFSVQFSVYTCSLAEIVVMLDNFGQSVAFSWEQRHNFPILALV